MPQRTVSVLSGSRGGGPGGPDPPVADPGGGPGGPDPPVADPGGGGVKPPFRGCCFFCLSVYENSRGPGPYPPPFEEFRPRTPPPPLEEFLDPSLPPPPFWATM